MDQSELESFHLRVFENERGNLSILQNNEDGTAIVEVAWNQIEWLIFAINYVKRQIDDANESS